MTTENNSLLKYTHLDKPNQDRRELKVRLVYKLCILHVRNHKLTIKY